MLANSFCGGMACQGIGVAIGLLGGLAVGDTIDKVHYVHRHLATLEATSSMKKVSWAQQAGNGMQAATGTIFPKRKFLHNANYRIGDDYHRVRGKCVDFDEEIHLQESGKTIKTKGRACQTTDGEWRII
jgi:surface antigen